MQFLPLHSSTAGDITQNKATVLQSGEEEKEGKGLQMHNLVLGGTKFLLQALFPEDY